MKEKERFNKFDFSEVLPICNSIFLIMWALVTKAGEGNGNPLQYSCLENLLDRGAWGATVQGVATILTRLK